MSAEAHVEPNAVRRDSTRTRARIPAPLALLVATAAFLSVAWIVSVPGFQGPDEGAHFAYTQYLAETGGTPQTSGGSGALSTEAATAESTAQLDSLIGIPGARPAWSPADTARWSRQQGAMGDAQRRDGSGPNRAGSNPPLYYAYEAIPYRVLRGQDLFTRLMGMRLASGVLTVLIVVMVWAIAGEVFGPDPWRRTIATGVAALHPMLGYIGSMVSPDALLAFIWTAFVLLAMRTLRRGPSIRRLLGAAALAVASVLTHGRGVAIVVPLLVLVLATGWRFQSVLATTLRRHRLAAGATVVLLLSPVLAWLALTLVVPGGGLLYGSQASIDGASFSVKQLLGVTWQFYFDRLPFMEPRIGPPYGYRQVYIETFFGTFGSLEVTFPGWVYDGIQLAVAIGLAALLATAIRHMKAVRRNAAVVLVLASVALAMIALLHVASYVNLLKDPSDPIFTGRYLLPLISLLGLAVAWVIGSLPRLASHIAGATLLGIGVLLSLAALGLSAARFYA